MFLFVKRITLVPIFYFLFAPSMGLAKVELSLIMVDNAFKKATESIFLVDKINPNFKVVVASKKTVEMDFLLGSKINVVMLSGIPKNMPSSSSIDASQESIFADYDFKNKECAVVVVKDNYPRFHQKIVLPLLASLSKFGISEEDVLASIFVHELGHCLENEQIMTTKVEQDFFELSPYSSVVGVYPSVGLELKIPYLQWRESFADVLQALFLVERSGYVDESINAIINVRALNAVVDKKHNTINALERLRGYLSDSKLSTNGWCDMAHKARSVGGRVPSKSFFDRCR